MNHFQGLRTIIYYVEDLPAATQWYSKVLGFSPYFNEPFYVGFNVGGYELGLHPATDRTLKVGNASETYWGVADAKKTYEYLLELGATEHAAPTNVGGDIIVATVLDPFGNIFGIIENPGFKAE